uniref:Beta-chimaerin n=2 Tax=Mesocestoides corti TaxID=53468 RepID=A0A5K3ESY6_MESCO
MVDRRSEMRIWQNKLYNLQREAPKPIPIVCSAQLDHVPKQYGAAYHGPLSRQGTEELLAGQPSGAYLIRDSQRADGAFTLAIRFDDSTKNYKLFYDATSKLHFVGEKKFESVDQLVADGLIYLYIESRGADILQKLSEANNYEYSPYYKTRYHTVNAVPPPPPTRQSLAPSSRLVVSAISGPNHRRQSSVDELLDGYQKTPTTQLSEFNPPVDKEAPNGDISDSPKNSSAVLCGPIEKPARSTSLPFPRPPLIESSTDSSLSPSAKPGSSTSTSSGDASLNSRQSGGSGNGRRKGGSSIHHHRSLASTLPVSLDGGLDVDGNRASLHVVGAVPPATATAATPLAIIHVDVEKAHAFRVHTFRGPHWCDFCTHFIWGLVSQGVRCVDCGFQAHKRCSISVPNDCLPDMKRLKRVFGVDLTSLVRAENRTVPQVLVKCITELERRGGLMTEGVYRVPGNQEIVEDFRIALDKDCESVDLSEKRCSDLNTITSLIKSFLRQLPIPLITYEAYPELIEVSRDEQLSDEQKHDLLKGCVQRLPPAHYHCLRYLMAHLNRVAANQQSNMMTSENLAIVFAPSLMSSSYTDPLSCLAGAKFEQAVVNRLIVDFPSIFDGDDGVATIPLSSSTSTTTSRSTNASSR